MRERFGVGHRATLQHFASRAGTGRRQYLAAYTPNKRDLIRLNRILPAGRPYCLEPASPAPSAALLGTARSWRGIVLYAPRTGGAYDSHHRTAGVAGCAR